jgi:hypothetical protein
MKIWNRTQSDLYRVIFPLLCIFLLTSCIEIKSFGDYSDKAALDNRLLGNWNLVSDNKGIAKGLVHSPRGDIEVTEVSGSYHVSFRNIKVSPNNASEAVYWLFKFGESFFMTPNDPSLKCDNCQLLKIEITDATLKIYDLSVESQDYVNSVYKDTDNVSFDNRLILEVLDSNTTAVLVDLALRSELWTAVQEYKKVNNSQGLSQSQ